MTIEQESRAAATRLLDFLASEFDELGVSQTAPDNAQYYYKLPAAMCYAGRRDVAYRTLEQFAARFMSSGTLDLSADPAAEAWTPYIGGWAATGAGLLGRFDLAKAMMSTVETFRDPATGGYLLRPPGGTAVMDVELTGAALMGSVWTYDFDTASGASRFLQTLLQKQPAPLEEFFLRMDLDAKVIDDRVDPTAHYGLHDPFASPAAFGTGIAGLVWYARISGDDSLINVADNYIRAALAHESDPAGLLLATKFGWSVQMVHAHRNRDTLSNLAKRCAAALIERQGADGSIDFSGLPASMQPGSTQWRIVLGCDCALTLMAVADQSA
ncbi:hypothetical protein FHT44_006304 [Mycolicibacterium sp. BK634]|uniref:hypothetical protein n=1 Tax=Mycolicibacterium sp. BK634 TaxID=2587099 RepID=UPI00161BA5CF|nr:hypothetical protein [Mycolicibacterium sp. BK634]MBB3753782.1 hypothetical protein [Mycolicibacterium sp. BK634]